MPHPVIPFLISPPLPFGRGGVVLCYRYIVSLR
nr:MAG TPA: hypothetical protein [Bacteriophage sp.]